MNEVEARDFLPGLGDQFTHRELIKSFRRQSFIMHPDTGGSDYDFGLLTEAYEFLKGRAVHELGKAVTEFRTVDGTPLTELGKGLPITINAIECDICEGRGYKSFTRYTREEKCSECEGEGAFFVPCKKCKGTGDYVNQRTGKVVGVCNLCGGNGRFYPLYKRRNVSRAFWFNNLIRDLGAIWIQLPNGQKRKVNTCRKCDGRGTVTVNDTSRLFYAKCDNCEGTGEIQIFNPVLPRGYLVGKRQ